LTSSDRGGNEQHLPGHPRISLNDIALLASFLEGELCSEDLEKMAPHFWMLSLHSSANISPLHRQVVKGREIIVSEDPILHLVWMPNRIHIKPLPVYLLSFVFWDYYLLSPTSPLPAMNRARILRAALGYLRTYYYLIRHESDLFLAQEKHLIPASTSWVQFCAFTSRFNTVTDADVSKRYAFGELRLTRLNMYCKFILRKTRLHRVPTTTYGAYFSRFHSPFLFVFGVLSVVLNSLQVGLAVEPLHLSKWPRLWTMGRVFAVSTLVVSFVLALFLLVLLALRFVSEWHHAICDEISRRRERKDNKKMSKSGEAA
jgi:hypothetical protein